MSETIDTRDITVTIHPLKSLHVRNPRGVNVRKIYGPAKLVGQRRRVRVSADAEPEVWIIFPTLANFGLNPDDILNAHWDGVATLTRKNRAGEVRNLIS